MRNVISVLMVAIFIMAGTAMGAFNGWNPNLSVEDNANAIFNSKEMNTPFDPIGNRTADMNWTVGDKPVRAIDGTPLSGMPEQDQIDAKNDAFLDRVDPYPQKVYDGKPVHKIDGSWKVTSDETLANKVLEDFLNR